MTKPRDSAAEPDEPSPPSPEEPITDPTSGQAASDQPASEAPNPEAPNPEEPNPEAPNPEAPNPEQPRQRRRMRPPRQWLIIGVLVALLGFGIAVQVRSNTSGDNLTSAREDDLVHILDDQNQRADDLRRQISQLQTTLQQLTVSGNRDTVARQQAEQELQALNVLLGTVPATGPGVSVTITDPGHKLRAEDLLDVVEELRGAGAEVIQFGPVRVSTSTSFTDDGSTVRVDGTAESVPYTVLAIGDPKTLDTALNIPGGVAATARAAGGDVAVTETQRIDISAVRAAPQPRYATPASR
jgi:uncharacterized protein YlxW (UPF0749 family)